LENVDIKYVIIGQLVEQNALLSQAVKQAQAAAQAAAQADKAKIAKLEADLDYRNRPSDLPSDTEYVYDHFSEGHSV
jgi:hypothetical protein